MTKFYTRDGDDGFTGLLGEERVPKYHPRLETLGSIDEASAAMGAARAICLAKDTAPILLKAQRDLYTMMAEIAATAQNAPRFRALNQEHVRWLEEQTDRIGAQLPTISEFILPGDSACGGLLSLARAIVRRAERHVAQLLHQGQIENYALLQYLNRLSSLCFVLELLENQAAGKTTPTLAKTE
jgi:cob(I)alamin adenosyltransferase